MAYKKLMRSNNTMIAGVCAGIAEYLNLDPTIIRVAYALLTIFSVGIPGVIAYFVLSLIMPKP